MFSRANIEIQAPSTLNLGSSFTAEIGIAVSKKTKVRNVTLELACVEHAIVRGTSDSHYRRDVFSDLRELIGRSVLQVGQSFDYVEDFQIPVTGGPSYAGRNHSVYWELRVRLDVPWWPDTRASHRIKVLPVRLEAALG